MLLISIVLRRVLRNWRISLVLAAGLLLGAGALAGVPTFAFSMAAGGLRQSLEEAGPAERNVVVAGAQDDLTPELYDLIQGDMGALLRARVEVRDAEAAGHFPLPVPVADAAHPLTLLNIARPEEALQVIAGELPITNTLQLTGPGCSVVNEAARDFAIPEPAPERPLPYEIKRRPEFVIPAAVSPQVAVALGLQLGDLVPIGRALPGAFQISAIAAPLDPGDERVWGGVNRFYLEPGDFQFQHFDGGLLLTGPDYRCFGGTGQRPLHYWWFSGQPGHLTVPGGRLPGEDPAGGAAPGGGPDQYFEAALGALSLEEASFGVGDRLQVADHTWIDIVGVVAPADPQDEFWLGDMRPFTGELRGGGNESVYSAPLFVSEATLRQLSPRHFAAWRLYVDSEQISYATAGDAYRRLNAIASRMAGRGSEASFSSGLNAIIQSYMAELRSVQIPLFLLAGQALALTLYTLALIAALALERNQGEMAVLSSRGGGPGQVAALTGLEALLLAIPAVALGPPLARAAVGAWFAGRAAGGAAPVAAGVLSVGPFTVGADSALALAAAGLGALAITLPALPLARRSLLAWQRGLSRPETRAAWHRLYLDLFLLALGGLAYWQLSQSGSFLARRFAGSTRGDALLLLSPTLTLAAAALIYLRLFPWLAEAAARAVGRARGLALPLSLARMARSPVGPARVILLISLAGALALFSSAFDATLLRSQVIAARAAAGADLRLALPAPAAPVGPGEGQPPIGAGGDRPFDAVAGAPGVTRASPTLRLTLYQAGADRAVTLLGVERASFAALGGTGLRAAMAAIAPAAPAPGALPLPEAAETLGLWLRGAGAGDSLQVQLTWRLREAASGRLLYLPLSAPDPVLGWQFLAAALPQGRAGPLLLEGLTVRSTRATPPVSVTSPHLSSFAIDDITVGDGSGAPLESFEGGAAWQVGQSEGNSRLELGAAPEAHSGGGALALNLRFLDTLGVIAGPIPLPDPPIPALVSAELARESRLEPGKSFELGGLGRRLTFEVVAEAAELPGLSGRFVLADFNAVAGKLDRAASRPQAPGEVWLDLSEAGYAAAVSGGRFTVAGLPPLPVLADSRALLRSYQADVLALGITRAFQWTAALAALLSAAGFLLSQYLAASRRTVEFGVLRSLGLSAGQLLAVLAAEGLVVIALGLGSGLLLGFGLAFSVRPYLALALEATGAGRGGAGGVLFNWPGAGRLYGTLLAAYALATLALAVALLRMGVHRVLRLGEE